MTELDLSDNRFTGRNTIPVGTFETLAALTTLDFSGNQVRADALDIGFFKGLSTLTTLDLTGQFSGLTGANAPATVNQLNEFVVLSFNATTNIATVSVKACTPTALTVTLAATGATDSTPDIVIPAGGCTMDATLTRTVAGTPISVTLPTATYTLPGNLVTSTSGLSIRTEEPDTRGICSRSPQVALGILHELGLGATSCAIVTDQVLASITTLDLSADSTLLTANPGSLNPAPPAPSPAALLPISALKAGDFNALPNLTSLDLGGQTLATLPATLFSAAGLAKLASLDLRDNKITTLPASTFASLPALTTLNLSGNEMATVPAGLFTGLQKSLTSSDLRGQFRNDSGTTTIAGLTALMSVSLNSTFVATVTAPTSVPSTTRVPLTLTGAPDGSLDYVDIAAGATSGTAQLAQASGETLAATLPPQGVTPSGSEGLSLIPALTGFCDRTAVVETALLAAITGISDCNNVTAAHLANITTLDLSAATIGTLAAGDFAGLSQLTTLNLSTDTLTALPADIFAGLGEVTTLDLSGNALTQAGLPSDVFAPMGKLADLNLSANSLTALPSSLLAIASLTTLNLADNQLKTTDFPARIFASLRQLTSLDLNGNQISYLRDGIFEGLTLPLTTLDLSDQFDTVSTITEIDTFYVTLSLEVDSNVATVTIPTGAPVALTLALTLTGAHANSPTMVSIAAGARTGTVTLTPATSGGTVTAALPGTAPTLANTITGLTLQTSGRAGICERSPQVQAALLDAISVITTCGAVAANTHLAAITELDLSSDAATLTAISATPITTLKSGDLAGLTALTKLDLDGQSLTAFSTDWVSDSTGLKMLILKANKITDDGLPSGLFSTLTSLTQLNLARNRIDTLPDNFFLGATLGVGRNKGALRFFEQFHDVPGEPKRDVKMPVKLVQSGTNSVNVTVTLPAGAFAPMAVKLNVEGATAPAEPTIAAGATTTSAIPALTPTVANVAPLVTFADPPLTWADNLTIRGIQIVTETGGVCGRTSAVRDYLVANTTATHCSGVTATMLTNFTPLAMDLSSSSITALKAGDFAGLTNITSLDLNDNDLTALPASIFAGLTSITSLDLSDNDLTALPNGIFNGLAAVTKLDLDNNLLTEAGVPGSIFSPLVKLVDLDLSDNAFNSLPNDIFKGLTLPLTNLDLTGQFSKDMNTTDIETFEVALTLTLDPDTLFATVVIPTGAPVAVTANLTLSGHGAGSPTSVTLPAGAVNRRTRLIAAVAGQPVTAVLAGTTPATLPAGIQGLTLKAAAAGICRPHRGVADLAVSPNRTLRRQ